MHTLTFARLADQCANVYEIQQKGSTSLSLARIKIIGHNCPKHLRFN